MRRDHPKYKWIQIRRDILKEVIASDVNRTWSVRELTAEMLKNELIQKGQPNLGKSVVHRDWLAIRNSIHKDIKELAAEYTEKQLEQLDHSTADILDEIEKLKAITYDDIAEPEDVIKLKAKVASQVKSLTETLLKIQTRESKIVPNEAPKIINVEEKKHFTIDMFHSARQELLNQQGNNTTIIEQNPVVQTNGINPLLVAPSDNNDTGILEGAIIDESDTIIEGVVEK